MTLPTVAFVVCPNYVIYKSGNSNCPLYLKSTHEYDNTLIKCKLNARAVDATSVRTNKEPEPALEEPREPTELRMRPRTIVITMPRPRWYQLMIGSADIVQQWAKQLSDVRSYDAQLLQDQLVVGRVPGRCMFLFVKDLFGILFSNCLVDRLFSETFWMQSGLNFLFKIVGFWFWRSSWHIWKRSEFGDICDLRVWPWCNAEANSSSTLESLKTSSLQSLFPFNCSTGSTMV